MSSSPERQTWYDMHRRCTDPRVQKYSFYGARGIKVCSRWSSFDVFLSDMGKRPSAKHSLDRLNTNGDYGPSNCRWATQKEQCRNTRKNRHITINGVTKCISEWAEEKGVKQNRIGTRLSRGWPEEDAIMTPFLRVGTFKRRME